MLINQRLAKIKNSEQNENEKKKKNLDDIKKNEILKSINNKQFQEARNKKLQSINQKMKTNDIYHALTLIIGLIISNVAENLDFNNNYNNNYYLFSTITKITNLILIPNLIIHVINHHKINLDYLKAKRLINFRKSIFSKNILSKIILEIFINIIIPIPFYQYKIASSENGEIFVRPIETYITAFMFLRWYIISRVFRHFSIWNNERSYRVCKLNGFNPSFNFTMKCYLKYRTFTTVYLLLFSSIIVFGWLVQKFDKGINKEKKTENEEITKNKEDISTKNEEEIIKNENEEEEKEEEEEIYAFDYLWNGLWVVIWAMTTVGYGDIYPKSTLGRVFLFISAVWGTFIMTLVIVTFMQIINFNKNEEKSYQEIILKLAKEKLKKKKLKSRKNKKIKDEDELPNFEVYDIPNEIKGLETEYNYLSSSFFFFYYNIKHNISDSINNIFFKHLNIESKMLKILDLNQKIYTYLAYIEKKEFKYFDINKVDKYLNLNSEVDKLSEYFKMLDIFKIHFNSIENLNKKIINWRKCPKIYETKSFYSFKQK